MKWKICQINTFRYEKSVNQKDSKLSAKIIKKVFIIFCLPGMTIVKFVDGPLMFPH